MGQPVVHWEFWSRSPERIAQFYAEAFDWTIRVMPELDTYRFVETGGSGGINGGIMKPKEGPWPGNMALYIEVDDLGAFAARVKDGGGRIIVEREVVPGIGQFSLFEDPDGRVLGMWQRG